MKKMRTGTRRARGPSTVISPRIRPGDSSRRIDSETSTITSWLTVVGFFVHSDLAFQFEEKKKTRPANEAQVLILACSVRRFNETEEH